MANVVRAAPAQATWTGDGASMVAEHEEHAREAARQGADVVHAWFSHRTQCGPPDRAAGPAPSP
jgi:hypothetical protein